MVNWSAVVCKYAAIWNKRRRNADFEPMNLKVIYFYFVVQALASVIKLDHIANNSSEEFPVQAAKVQNDEFQEYSLSLRTKLNPAVMKYVCKYNPKAILRFEDTGTIMVPDIASWSMAAKKYKYYEVDTSGPKTAENDEESRPGSGDNDEESRTKESQIDSPLFPASNCVLVADSEGNSGSVSLNYALKLLIQPHTAMGANWVVSTLAFKFGSTAPVTTTSGSWTGSHTCIGQKGTATRLMYRPPIVQLQAKGRAIYYDKRANKLDQEPNWTAMDPVKMITEEMPFFYCMNWKGTECEETQSEYVDEAGTQYVAQMY